jgi:zinc transporter, ZIP family
MSDVAIVFGAALATALATGLGAIPLLMSPRLGTAWLGLGNALAAGFMVGASIGLLVEGAGTGIARAVIGAVLGWLGIAWLGAREVTSASALVVGVMTIHSLAEGIGVGVSFGTGAAFGLLVALAIGVHNIPEGLAISLVLVPRGSSVASAALWSIFSSLPQPLLAVPSFLFVSAFDSVLPVGLGVAAGAMGWLALRKLAPASRPRYLAGAAVPAAAVMLAFQLVLVRS